MFAHHRCAANWDPNIQQSVCSQQYGSMFSIAIVGLNVMETPCGFYFIKIKCYLSNSKETKPYRTDCMQAPVDMVTNNTNVVVRKCK